MKCYTAKKEEVVHDWKLMDAEGQILGRLAVKVAQILMGKHKPIYTPHVDTGDFVVVVNAEKIQVSGNKASYKEYDRYTHYPGGRRITSFEDMMEKHPERVIEMAVKRMLPKNRLGTAMFSKLKVYAGPDHKHAAQNPVKIN